MMTLARFSLVGFGTCCFALSAGGQTASLQGATGWEVVEGGSATAGQNSPGYVQKIQIRRPVPTTSLDGLATVNPALPKLLPDLGAMLENAEVSSRWDELYDAKIAELRAGVDFTTHNFYDCETILRMQHPSGQKVLWLQADMDNVTDGSDGVRQPNLADYDLARTSDWFLPQTAYSWGGGNGENPFLDYYPMALARLSEFRTKLAEELKGDPGVVWRELLQTCDDQIYRVKARGLTGGTPQELATRRFLVSTIDPFVVLPKTWANSPSDYAPRKGDFCVVLYKDKAFATILGDYGPASKIGEASLKLARALNPLADGKSRAVDLPEVSYLFFPRSALPAGEPDLERWHAECTKLLEKIGAKVTLHRW